MDEPTYKDIKQMENDDDDEEQEEYKEYFLKLKLDISWAVGKLGSCRCVYCCRVVV